MQKPANSKKTLDTILKSVGTPAKQFAVRETEDACAELIAYLKDNVATNPVSFLKELTAKLVAEDFANAKGLIDQLLSKLRNGSANYESGEARAVLKALKKHRQFQLMPCVADAFISTGITGGDTD